MDDKIIIREMTKSDCPLIAQAFTDQGWDKPTSQYLRYFQESVENKRAVLIAETDGCFAGYVTILWISTYPPFTAAGIPEIADFNVLKKYRRMGIGTRLMDEAEKRIAAKSLLAGLGFCVERDYGPAQVLYIKRGYVPDGKGVFYHGRYPTYGEQVTIQDDLSLYLTKLVK
jgi:ribosomal protein S18 acetylase RimI-like enzyme